MSVRALFDQHADFVWRVLARSGVRDADLKDALQEVFMVVAEKVPQLDPGIKPTSWLYGIAMRVAANHRRKIARKRETQDDDRIDALEDQRGTPEEAYLESEATHRLAALLGAIPAEQRIVFEMFELEERTCPDIAEALGIPLGTTYSRLRLARAALVAAARDPLEDT